MRHGVCLSVSLSLCLSAKYQLSSHILIFMLPKYFSTLISKKNLKLSQVDFSTTFRPFKCLKGHNKGLKGQNLDF